MCCRRERTWLAMRLIRLFSISAAASTAQLLHMVGRTSSNTKNLCKSFQSDHSIGTRGVWIQGGLSTDIQICSPVATYSLPVQFILPAANASSQSPLQMATRTILPLVHNSNHTQNKADLPETGEGCNSPGLWFTPHLLPLKSGSVASAISVSNQRPEEQLISGQWYIYAEAQHIAQAWRLYNCHAYLSVQG